MKLYDNDAYRDEFKEFVYGLLHSDGINDRANQIIDAFDSAPAVEAEPMLPNAPLTLDELRKMDGEPVWVEDMSVDETTGMREEGTWAILETRDGRAVAMAVGFSYREFAYGKLWLAYRHRPEEDGHGMD